MNSGFILDPTATLADDRLDPGPDAVSVSGKTIGFRVDILWRSWDWVAEIWAERLQRAGARTRFWRPTGRSGEQGERALREMRDFFASVDIAVVGLANCGSCTGWTIHDAVAAAATGIPTLAVATKHFEQLAAALAARAGHSGLRRFLLPYPLDVLSKEQVDAIAHNNYEPFLRALGVRDRLAHEQAA